jgi:hypothetical protein
LPSRRLKLNLTCGARVQLKAFNVERQLSRIASYDTSQETGYASSVYLSNAKPRFCKGLKMESQLRDQLNRMQPLVAAARELVEAVQPWLQAPANFDPVSPTPNYPTWELDKHSFDALGKLLLAFRFAEPDAYVPALPSDSMVLSHIYTLLEQMWPDYDTIDGPFMKSRLSSPLLAAGRKAGPPEAGNQ